MNCDQSQIDDAVLALLAEFSPEERRAWKGFDFGAMDRLYARDFIDHPASKANSVWLTPRELEHGREIAGRPFSGDLGHAGEHLIIPGDRRHRRLNSESGVGTR